MLKFASCNLCNNKDIVLQAVKLNWEAFYYASEQIKNDFNAVLEAAKINSKILTCVSVALRQSVMKNLK